MRNPKTVVLLGVPFHDVTMEETLAAMHDLFHTLNQARYAPQSTNAELVSLAVNVEDALNILKNLQA